MNELTVEEWRDLQENNPVAYARARVAYLREWCPPDYAGMAMGALDDRDAEALVNIVDDLCATLEGSRIGHLSAEDGDPYHSCLVDCWEECDGKGERPECDCGADEHNARIDAALKRCAGKCRSCMEEE